MKQWMKWTRWVRWQNPHLDRMDITLLVLAFILGLLLLLPLAASAQWSSTDSRTSWLSAVGATESDVVTIPFSGGRGTEITDQYAAQGVLFTDWPPPEVLDMAGLGNGKGLYRVGLSGPLTMEFPVPVVAVGIDYGQTTEPRLEAVGYTSPTYAAAPSGQVRFMGVTNPEGITEIELWSSAGTAKMVTLYLVASRDLIVTCTTGGAIPTASVLLELETGAVAGVDVLDYAGGEKCSEIPTPVVTEPTVFIEIRYHVVVPSP